MKFVREQFFLAAGAQNLKRLVYKVYTVTNNLQNADKSLTES